MKLSSNNRHLFFVVFMIFVLLSSYSYTQQIISDHVKFENGVLKADAITLNFKDKVFDLPIGQSKAYISDIGTDFRELKEYFEKLSEKYDGIFFKKHIPKAKWGGRFLKNINSGEIFKSHDWSQLFSIIFTKHVPAKEIISELLQFKEVEYAHEPWSIASYSDPPVNDDEYEDQWNLSTIETEKAGI